MEPAPSKTPPRACAAASLPSAVVTNSALDQIEVELDRQRRELDLAFASVAGLGDVSFVVNPELLEAIDAACTVRSASRGALIAFSRC